MNDGPILFLILMIASGVVGIYVDRRCRPWSPGLEGFTHGFLLGPIGWILLALYPTAPPQNPNDKK